MSGNSNSKALIRVLIVGAGIFGASIAHHRARCGPAVALVGRAGPAAEASSRSIGWINASYGNPGVQFSTPASAPAGALPAVALRGRLERHPGAGTAAYSTPRTGTA